MKFVTRREIEALGIDNAVLVAALEDAFCASHAGEIVGRPKSTVNQPDGAFFIGRLQPGRSATSASSTASWAAASQSRAGRGALPDISVADRLRPRHAHRHDRRSLYLDDAARRHYGHGRSRPRPPGQPDRHDRRRGAAGAGEPRRTRRDLPLRRDPHSRSLASNAENFALEIRRRGLQARIIQIAEEAIRGADLIVSTVPSGPALKPFLDPGWVAPGAFVSAVDLGRSWLDGFEAFDRIVTDDRAQAIMQHAEGRVRYGGAYDTEIPSSSPAPGRRVNGRRTASS